MSDVLLRAHEITLQRGKSYGHPSVNFRRIIDYWNLWLKQKLREPLTEEDHAMMMVFVKIAREQELHTDDNIADSCGYLRNYMMIMEAKNCTRNGINGPHPDDPPKIFDSSQYGET